MLFNGRRRTVGSLDVAVVVVVTVGAVTPHLVTMTTVHRLVLQHAADVLVVSVGHARTCCRTCSSACPEAGVARRVARPVLKIKIKSILVVCKHKLYLSPEAFRVNNCKLFHIRTIHL